MATLTRSYGDQARHYFFERPHASLRTEPAAGPDAWRGDALRRDEWCVELASSERDELRRALDEVLRADLAPGSWGAEAFPLPTLAPRIVGWRHELSKGRGFLLVRGLPVEELDDEEAGQLFWGLGLHLGWPGAQNVHGDLLGHVVDTGEDAADPFVRRYRTAGDIAYHCDAADVVGLLCLRTAREGGASRLASSVTVHDQLLRERPEWAPRLYEPFALDLRNENREGPNWIPVVPCRHADGRLRTFYHSDYFRSAVRHEDVAPFSELEQGLLDLYEEIAMRPGVFLDMELAVGDLQLVSNHTVIHARTAYRDDVTAPGGGRHLLRLWLTLPED